MLSSWYVAGAVMSANVAFREYLNSPSPGTVRLWARVMVVDWQSDHAGARVDSDELTDCVCAILRAHVRADMRAADSLYYRAAA